MVLPFYIPEKNPPNIIIVGGGYSGIAALVTLKKHSPGSKITMIDPKLHHLKITHLHETFRKSLNSLKVPFKRLEERFGIRHIQSEIIISEENLKRWDEQRHIKVGDENINFDYLLISTGSPTKPLQKNQWTCSLDDFTQESGSEILKNLIENNDSEDKIISVVGGGPTGIQFLFEIQQYLQENYPDWKLRLVDADPLPLGRMNSKFGEYVLIKMAELDVSHHPDSFFEEQTENKIRIKNRYNGTTTELPSAFTFVFIGKSAQQRIDTNWFGQVVINNLSLDRIFAAGDCSEYRLPGSNNQNAQSAVRKGQLAARNILRHSGSLPILEPYLHQNVGYVVSLGATDSIGWLGMEQNIISGTKATALKEVVETQFDFLLAGTDTYTL